MTDQIDKDFKAFHMEHPEVYHLFNQFTRELMISGAKHGSAKLVMERIRWEHWVGGKRDPVKINNNYSSRYARRWELYNPEHKGFFRMRKLRERSVNSTEYADPVYSVTV